MNKISIGACLLLALASNAYCQFKVRGIVFSEEEKQGVPGVSVLEKGTKNGTVTDIDGSFVLAVSDSSATLEFKSIGHITEEYPLRGSDSLSVKIKTDCTRHFFDSQSITFYARSGVINTPFGGQIDFAFPNFHQGTLITGLSYQAGMSGNNFINAKAEYKHFFFNCDFDIDANWYFRRISPGEFELRTHSFESNFNYDGWRATIGYSNLSINKLNQDEKSVLSAPLIGVGRWIETPPVQILITGKSAIYKVVAEWVGEVTFYTKYVELFVNYYRVDDFSEVSIGIGKEIGYWLKSQKQYRQDSK